MSVEQGRLADGPRQLRGGLPQRLGLGVGAKTRYIPIQHIADASDGGSAAVLGAAAFLLLGSRLCARRTQLKSASLR
jgi:hypothetical protein